MIKDIYSENFWPQRFTLFVLVSFLVCMVGGNTAAASPAHKSMIQNGDFEGMFDEKGMSKNWYAWTIHDDDDGIVVSFQNDSHPMAGNGAQQLICTDHEGGRINFVNNNSIPIRKGHDYKISLWMKGRTQGPVTVSLQNLSGNGYPVFMTENFNVTDDWSRFEFTQPNLSCKGGVCDARIRIIFSSGGSLSVDNVKVHDMDYPVIDGTVYLDSDPNIGSDDNDGRSPATPWLTLDKLYEHDVLPGARILFKSGGQWQGPVMVSCPDYPTEDKIYYGRYGNGQRPVINGAMRLRNWRPYDDGDPNTNIHVVENVDQDVAQLFVDGQRQVLARYPNQADQDTITYNIVTSACREDCYDCLIDENDSRKLDADYWIGADVHIRTRAWMIEKSTVTGHVPEQNKITLNPSTRFDIQEGYGYYFENKFEELDAPGEWYYHSEEKKLYYWPLPDVDINNCIVEASVKNYGFTSDANAVEHIVIEGFDIRNFTDAGIKFNFTYNTQFRDNKIHRIGKNGIHIGLNRIRMSENISIVENEIEDILQHGIVITKVKGCTIEKNKIQNCQRTSILYQSNDNGVIADNHIRNSGYNGISMHGNTALSNNLVEGNRIDRSCLLLDDGAGIYCGGDNGQGNQLKNNIITNSIGNGDGKPSKNTAAQGLYLDEKANQFVLSGNVVLNTDYGVQIHNANRHTVQNNIVYMARNAGIILTHNGQGKEDRPVYGNVIDDANIFHSVSDRKHCVFMDTVFEGCLNCDIEGFATFDQNFYAHPNHPFTFRRGHPGEEESFSLTDWQAATGQDNRSVTFDGARSEIFINDQQTPQTFDLEGISYVTLDNEAVGTTVEVDAFSAQVLVRKELDCADGVDDDQDGDVDSDDPDCQSDAPVRPTGLSQSHF